MRRLYIILLLIFFSFQAKSQVLLNDVLDTTSSMGKGFLSLYEQYNWLRFSGYLQPQFQHAESEGAPSFNGGDFSPNSDNRFTLRRGRMRIDYMRRSEDGYPTAQLVFQFDGTERGFFTRDFWGRAFENRWHLFSVTGGIFARPFGYEVNLGSGDRESPERGRASQLLMRTERDIGAMLTLEPRTKGGKLHWLRADLAVVNGPGLSGITDYDSRKDVIGRIYCKPAKLGKHRLQLSGGASVFNGGIVSNRPILYQQDGDAMRRDSSADNIGKLVPRRYYGADAQLKIPNRNGFTELRAEYLRGQQSGTIHTSETPGTLTEPLASRHFDAAYFYFLQHLGSIHHQVVVKYDWYDPNSDAAGGNIVAMRGHTGADVKFSTLGGGYRWHVNASLLLMLYYEHPMNEKTGLTTHSTDLLDDNFTVRLQFRF